MIERIKHKSMPPYIDQQVAIKPSVDEDCSILDNLTQRESTNP